MTSPSLPSLESTTRSSVFPQKGQRISLEFAIAPAGFYIILPTFRQRDSSRRAALVVTVTNRCPLPFRRLNPPRPVHSLPRSGRVGGSRVPREPGGTTLSRSPALHPRHGTRAPRRPTY